MLKINPLAPCLAKEERARLEKLATANVCDALLKLKVPRGGCLDSEIKPLEQNMKFVGVAFTVHAPLGNSLPVQCSIKMAQPGYALCVATDGYMDGSYIGDLTALVAQKMGLDAVVIDGLARDTEEIAKTGFPLFARGAMPRKPGKADDGELNGTVKCGGLEIQPGDILMGDRDGVIAIPRNLLAKTLDEAEAKVKADEERLALIQEFFAGNECNKAGKDILCLLNKDVQSMLG